MISEILTPVEQDDVTLSVHPVTPVRLPDGRVAAVLTDLCRALDRDRSSQARRVRIDEVTSGELLLAGRGARSLRKGYLMRVVFSDFLQREYLPDKCVRIFLAARATRRPR